jgi:Ca2+-dependent lipid-binding protein
VLHKATNLVAGDANGSSDPYVQLTHGDVVFKTATKRRTKDPVYEQEFDFLVDDTNVEMLDVHVFDYDRLSSRRCEWYHSCMK